MNCQEAAEFVSVLSDGEVVPSVAAEHIGKCATCQARLQNYLAMGAEMRRVASLEMPAQVPIHTWIPRNRNAPSWWTKGWESMRIPRFAFALLLIAIMGLGSGLIVTRAKAHTEGSVLLLTAKAPDGLTMRCALSLVDKKWDRCAQLNPPQNMLGIRVLSHTADQIELGIREQYTATPARAGNYSASLNELEKVPEISYWFHPGEKLEIPVPGSKSLELTGELTDHIPPFPNSGNDTQIDPTAGEMRITSPILLRGDKVVFDSEGASSIQTGGHVVQMYSPGHGLWVISPRPLAGAVEAEVALSRIKFSLHGEQYTFLVATPVTREQHVWVLHDPNYKPSDPSLSSGFLGGADPEHLANSPTSVN